MAIVINGSGTVTGLAVGGLPDGTVDAGTLATNSVDSAELIDGAVDDSHMAAMAASKLTGALPAISGASLTGFTDAQMPAGSVLQVVQGTIGAGASSTSTTYVATGLTATITPTSSSSKILVMAGGWLSTPANENHAALTLYRGSTDLGNSYGFGNFYTANGGYTESLASFNYLDSPSTTSATGYEVYLRRGAGSGSVEFGSSARLSTIILMEIAG